MLLMAFYESQRRLLDGWILTGAAVAAQCLASMVSLEMQSAI